MIYSVLRRCCLPNESYIVKQKVKSIKRSTYNVLFVVNSTKKLKDGSLPVYLRLTINSERTEFALQRTIREESWVSESGRTDGKTKHNKEVNSYIDFVRSNLLLKKRELEERVILVTAEALKNAYLGIEHKVPEVLELFRDHNEKCKKLEGKDFAPGTVVKYATCYNHVEAFIKQKFHAKDVRFIDINNMFLKDFEIFLKTERGCQHNTAIKYLANFKKIVRIALANGWLKVNPFANYAFKLDDVDMNYLNEKELTMLMNKDFRIERVQQVRDVFLFCCFTGLAFSDVKSLNKKDIVEKDGQLWIVKKRQKTKNWCNIPLMEPALQILERYEEHAGCIIHNRLLPVYSNQKMNAYLKEIADLTGINKSLSTHSARHTFATTVTLTNQVSIKVVNMLEKADFLLTNSEYSYLPKTVNYYLPITQMRKRKKTKENF